MILASLSSKALIAIQSREELRESEMVYRKFFEEDITGDFIASSEGELLLFNPNFCRIFNCKTADKTTNKYNLKSFFPDETEWRNF